MLAGFHPPPLTLTHTKDVWSGPSSPSLSRLADLPRNELVQLLKSARTSLREKEKDIRLAAEVGHYLLENNQHLQHQYETLCHQQDQRACRDRRQDQLVEQLQESNMELQLQLQDMQQETQRLERHYNRHGRDLQHDIAILQEHLDLASQKMVELEETQQRRLQRTDQAVHHDLHQRLSHDFQDQDDVKLLEERMDRLQQENLFLQQSRRKVQQRLDEAMAWMNSLAQQTQDHHHYQDLQLAYDQQAQHITQLHQSLEDHRWQLAQIQHHPPLDSYTHPFYSHPSSPRLLPPSLATDSSSASPSASAHEDDQPLHFHSLMDELAQQTHYTGKSQVVWTAPEPLTLAPDLQPSLSKLPHDFGPLNATLTLATYHLYPSPCSVTPQPLPSPRPSLVQRVRQWCRFAIVLTLSAVINVIEGPDSMLIQ
ncbi:hypothetical protein DM01DRAFT_1405420 [Hesseltinella vesiculosa]|uniref:Uncharacterized protein n=1 Tax=Hesseltinella vesiculosa TaxID=101127 RepID=A0A1X2GPW9_9FUNG|nr:hypothetical protein DM01DRAFT_1405420 [Hesseltinella vesiculosa]